MGEFSIDWLYPELAEYYAKWIPEGERSEFMANFAYRGVYSIKVKEDLRLVMVNPNGCLGYNL